MTINNWMEAAYEHFQGAIEEGNYSLAQDVIADARDKGFTVEAAKMEQELLDTPVEIFAIKKSI